MWQNHFRAVVALTFALSYVRSELMYIRYHSRFFVQLGHETTYAPSGNKHFFTKSCHRQTYQIAHNIKDRAFDCYD